MPRLGETVRHILLRDFAKSVDFQQPVGGGARSGQGYPDRDYRQQGTRLMEELKALGNRIPDLAQERRKAHLENVTGVTATFELILSPELRNDLNKLEDLRAGIQLLNVQNLEEETARATVFIPEGQLRAFERKLEAYLDDKKVTCSGRRGNELLVNSIEQIRNAVLDDFWTDDWEKPTNPEADFWSEVWIRNEAVFEDTEPEANNTTVERFRPACERLGIRLGARHLRFPDRTVVLAYATLNQLRRSAELLDSIAEIRRPSSLALEFVDRDAEHEKVKDLSQRLRAPEANAPAVCLLDTGVDYAHPLLSPAIDPDDVQTYDPAWPELDVDGHGTEMAGFAIYGASLDSHLLSQDVIQLSSRLESVKIMPDGGRQNAPELYGDITGACVALAEVQNPDRLRVFSMAVTADGQTGGKDTSWSAAIDQLSSGQNGEPRRLLLLAAGNANYRDLAYVYPDSNQTEQIQDPGQSWNALTVGSSTYLRQILEQDRQAWQPVAPAGDLAPSSRTSLTWPAECPLKPDIVLEGGNLAQSPDGIIDSVDSLQLLTTRRRFHDGDRPLKFSGETSGATTVAANMTARILSSYPDLWPETVRGLLVHSARWTDTMAARFPENNNRVPKERIRCYGCGIPNLDRALYSVSNRLNLIAQEEIQPFRKGKTACTANEMHSYKLPWPEEVLAELGETIVRMRVTLSYFVEPNPSRRGLKGRYQYQSCGLRFDVKSATESLDEFGKRVNKVLREEGEKSPGASDASEWKLGPQLRSRGSIHTDVWEGTAADLASKGMVAVYPVTGWWKLKKGFHDYRTRYSLIISIETDEIEVDLYTAVLNQIAVRTEV